MSGRIQTKPISRGAPPPRAEHVPAGLGGDRQMDGSADQVRKEGPKGDCRFKAPHKTKLSVEAKERRDKEEMEKWRG